MRIPGLRLAKRYCRKWHVGIFIGLGLMTLAYLTVEVKPRRGSASRNAAIGTGIDTGATSLRGKVQDNNGAELDAMRQQQLQLNNARLAAELKLEQLRVEMLEKDVELARLRVRTTDPPTESSLFIREQRARLKVIKDVCNDGSRPKGQVNQVITSKEGLTYCVMPRSAHTFWLKIYRYHNRDYTLEEPANPLDLNGREVRDRAFVKTKVVSYARLTEKEKERLQHNTRAFVTVQNPYIRLWNTYVDSFLLPEYWSSAGVKIQRRRKQTEVVRIKKLARLPCGDDVTFAEFLEHALITYEANYDPYYRQCDPCLLKPAFVIKEETARADNLQVLGELNLAWVVKGDNYTDDNVIRQINDSVRDNFNYFRASVLKKCSTPAKLGRRLWDVFAIRGIIPEAVAPPVIDVEANLIQLTHLLIDTYRKARKNGLDGQAQRRRHLVEAYRAIQPDLLAKIKTKYKMDFKLFGYSDNVDDL